MEDGARTESGRDGNGPSVEAGGGGADTRLDVQPCSESRPWERPVEISSCRAVDVLSRGLQGGMLELRGWVARCAARGRVGVCVIGIAGRHPQTAHICRSPETICAVALARGRKFHDISKPHRYAMLLPATAVSITSPPARV